MGGTQPSAALAAVVITREGKQVVPITPLVDLFEAVQAERETGKRRLHVLEPTMTAARARANALRPEVSDDPPTDRHDHAERRNCAYHAAVARDLRKGTVEGALHQLWRWAEEGNIDPCYAQAWHDVLRKPLLGDQARADRRQPVGS